MKITNRFGKCLLGASLSVAAFISAPVVYAGEGIDGQAASLTLANNASYLTNRIIVKYKDSTLTALSLNESGLTASGQVLPEAMVNQLSLVAGVQMKALRVMATGAHVVQFSGQKSLRDVEAMAAQIANNPEVEYAEPDRLLQPMFTPNDSRYNEQWHYFESTGGLNLPTAWDKANGSGVTVAVIDTGYRPHADLNANIVGGYDFISDTTVAQDGNGRDADARDPGDWTPAGACGFNSPPQDRNSSWHGTHVAGTVAAVTNNGSGVAGVAFGARVVPVRVLGRCGGFTSDIADAVIWSSGGSVSGVPANANPAQVINMSLGGGGACGSTMQNAINSANGRGTTVVVAAGNSNANAGNANPANCGGVVAVAATDRSGGKAFYSNFGSVVDVAAPGGELSSGSSADGVLSTLNSGARAPGSDSFAFFQGTSMATPHVAGVAALIYEKKAGATAADVESILKNTARAFPATCSQCGAGIVDANAAVDAAIGGGGTGESFENTANVNIPDNNATGVSSSIDVPRSGSSGIVSVDVNIRHTWIGDLIVDLIHPDNTVFNLHNRSGGSANNIVRTYSVNVGSKPSNGTWRLRVRDRARFDTGFIDSWKITF